MGIFGFSTNMPSSNVRAAGAFQASPIPSVHAAGAWNNVKTIYARAAGAWQTIWQAFTPHNTMVAGVNGTLTGFVTSSWSPPGAGTMSPSTDPGAHQIVECGSQSGSLGFVYFLFSAASLGQSYFTTFQIQGSDIGLVSLASSAATYSYDGTNQHSVWTWPHATSPILTSGNSYGILTT